MYISFICQNSNIYRLFIEKKLHKIRKSRKFIPREIHFSS